jgi:predicted ferric reductase
MGHGIELILDFQVPNKRIRLDILDTEAVALMVTIPNCLWWPYKAGQYIFLQVPKLSFLQWHPFTISTCISNEKSVHIKTDGDWTSKLRGGPFGAPAQRFYDFNHRVILGSGMVASLPFAEFLPTFTLEKSDNTSPTTYLMIQGLSRSHPPCAIYQPTNE